MALRGLQASLLAEREQVLSSLELSHYAGPALPVANNKRKRSTKREAGKETKPQRRSTRGTAAGAAALSGSSGVSEEPEEIERLPVTRAPPKERRIHTPRVVGGGELHVMLQLTKGKSDKFYEITTEANRCITRNGRRGAAGVERILNFDTDASARAFFYEQQEKKRSKGYYDGSDGSEEGAKLVPLGRWTA